MSTTTSAASAAARASSRLDRSSATVTFVTVADEPRSAQHVPHALERRHGVERVDLGGAAAALAGVVDEVGLADDDDRAGVAGRAAADRRRS